MMAAHGYQSDLLQRKFAPKSLPIKKPPRGGFSGVYKEITSLELQLQQLFWLRRQQRRQRL